jgi:hypothetical protein
MMVARRSNACGIKQVLWINVVAYSLCVQYRKLFTVSTAYSYVMLCYVMLVCVLVKAIWKCTRISAKQFYLLECNTLSGCIKKSFGENMRMSVIYTWIREESIHNGLGSQNIAGTWIQLKIRKSLFERTQAFWGKYISEKGVCSDVSIIQYPLWVWNTLETSGVN